MAIHGVLRNYKLLAIPLGREVGKTELKVVLYQRVAYEDNCNLRSHDQVRQGSIDLKGSIENIGIERSGN